MAGQEETSASQSPGQHFGNIDPAVLEVCGMDNVTLVETMSAEMLAWRDVTQLPDPFVDVLRPSHRSPETVLPDGPLRDSIREVKRAEDISYQEDPTREVISEIVRAQAPTLAEASVNGRHWLNRRMHFVDGCIGQVGSIVSEAIEEGELSVGKARQLHDDLAGTTLEFPEQSELEILGKIVSSEIGAHLIDSRTVGARQRPDIAAQYMHVLRNRSIPNEVATEKMNRLANILREEGGKSRQLRRAHRDLLEILYDEDGIQADTAQLKVLKAKGSAVHSAIVEQAKEAIVGPAESLFVALTKLKEGNVDLLERGRSELSAEQLAELRGQCLEVERYVAGHARVAIASMQIAGRKPTPDTRRRLQALTEESLRRAYDREQRANLQQGVGTTSVATEVAPDLDFRRACSGAKKIVDGGDHLDHPHASTLAKSLHAIVLGGKENIRLNRQQKGIVVALLTTGLSPLLAALERIQSGSNDAQVALLRQQSPQQFAAIHGLDFHGSIRGLKRILDKQHCREQLADPLAKSGFEEPEQHISAVRQTVEELVQQFEAAA